MNEEEAHALVDDIVVAGIVVNVDCDIAKRRYFTTQLGEKIIVLTIVMSASTRKRRRRTYRSRS
jgi:hypothetical protein